MSQTKSPTPSRRKAALIALLAIALLLAITGAASARLPNQDEAPPLSLVKTAGPATYSAVGEVITYSYVVKNVGDVILAGPVTVADSMVTVTCPAGGLAPNASMTCTASYTITQADLDFGSVTNTAQAHANGADSNTAFATVTAVQNRALSLVKTATPATYSAVNEVITYSYVVKNIGNVTLADPVTVDDNMVSVTCPAGGLAPNASMTCTASYTIAQADLDFGSVTNTAQAHANGADSNTAFATVPAVRGATVTACKVDTEGQPVPGWQMSVGGQTKPTELAEDEESACATFTLTQPGHYTLTEEDRGGHHGWTHMGEATWEFEAASGGVYSHTFTNFQWATVTACKVDTEGQPVPGWQMSVGGQTKPTELAEDEESACATFTLTQPGHYTLTEEDRGGHHGWTHMGEATWNFFAESGGSYSHTFTNFQWVHVTACKIDTEGHPVAGWQMSVGGQTKPTELAEDEESACATFTLTQPGHYTLTEEDRDGWTHIDDATWDFEAASGGAYSHIFTNFKWAHVTACKEDTEGLPVAGWHMDLLTWDDGEGDWSRYISGHTGTDGCVTLTIQKPGEYRLAEEIRAGWRHMSGMTRDFTAASGDVLGPFTFTNFEWATVTACKVDTEGHPVAGWQMSVGGQTKPTELVEVEDEESACATFTLTRPGDYTLTEEARAGWTQGSPHPYWRFTAQSGGTYRRTFVNFQNATVKACKTDTGGEPIGGWRIDLADEDDVIASDLTAEADGCVEFAITRAGDYTISEEARDGWTAIQPTSYGFTAASGGAYGPYTFVNFQGANITACKQTTEGAAVQDWLMTLTGPDPKAGKTLEDGCITWTVTQPGQYTVTEEDQMGWSHQDAASADFEVVSGGGPYSHTFVNFQNVDITVCKTNPKGNPIAGWGVYLNADAQKTAEAAGCYTWTVTKPGAYTATEEARAGWAPVVGISHDFVVTSSAGGGTYTFVNGEYSATIDKQVKAGPAGNWQDSAEVLVGTPLYYQFAVKNTGDVPLANVKITDPTLGKLIYNDPAHVFCTYAPLAVGAEVTCGPLGPVAAAFDATNKSVNTASVDGCYTSPADGKDYCAHDDDTATVYRQSGVLLPTTTTCDMYKQWYAGTKTDVQLGMYPAFNYRVKNAAINSISPGVIFYYNRITLTASGDIVVLEKNGLNWPAMQYLDSGQAILYRYADCSKSGIISQDSTSGAEYKVTFTRVPAGDYVIGIKYSPKNVIGQSVSRPYPTSIYTWQTYLNAAYKPGSTDSIPLLYKP